jgi:hypothetical protein
MSCAETTDTKVSVLPDDVGKESLQLFKKIQTQTKTEFLQNFLTGEELFKLSQERGYYDNISEKPAMLKKRKAERVNSQLSVFDLDYNNLKTELLKLNVNLENAVYKDWIYEDETQKRAPSIDGKCYFTHEGELYHYSVDAVKSDTGYRIRTMSYLKKARK